jgi:hypothetical protein
MAEESGQDSTSKQDALIVTGDDLKATESEETEDTASQSEEKDSPSSEKEIYPCGHILDCDCEKVIEPPQEEVEELNEFDQLIALMLELEPEKYAQPWEPIELQKMREVLTAGRGKFPKKVFPYIHLIRKFLFANAQLIAMAALAHQTAIRKGAKEEQLIKPASFSDLGKVEATRLRGE